MLNNFIIYMLTAWQIFITLEYILQAKSALITLHKQTMDSIQQTNHLEQQINTLQQPLLI